MSTKHTHTHKRAENSETGKTVFPAQIFGQRDSGAREGIDSSRLVRAAPGAWGEAMGEHSVHHERQMYGRMLETRLF